MFAGSLRLERGIIFFCQRAGKEANLFSHFEFGGNLLFSMLCIEKGQIKKSSLISQMELKIDIVRAVTNALFIVMDYDLAKKWDLQLSASVIFKRVPCTVV